MVNVKRSSVLNIINASVKPGNTFMKITTCTEPAMNKKSRVSGNPNPYTDVKCISELTISLGFDYESAVNRQRIKELMDQYSISKENAEIINEQFYSQSLWKGKGQHVNRYTVTHTDTGKLYLIYRPNTKISQMFINSIGQKIPEEALEEYCPPKSKSASQGLEKEVQVRTLKLESILQFVINGITYNVED